MNIRIAILAALASTLVLAQADVSSASQGSIAASEAGAKLKVDGSPEHGIVVAQGRPWMHQQPGMGGARFDARSRRVDPNQRGVRGRSPIFDRWGNQRGRKGANRLPRHCQYTSSYKNRPCVSNKWDPK